uniref:Uncharacterized protein n=1 Tax=Musca domestica TaxID=7370 RepID=A0A1I8MGF6_MUSDO
MLLNKFMSSCVLLIGLLAEANSAPTHHLTIGVDGNTPTLKVTSAELGLSAKEERQAKIRKELKINEKQKTFKSKTNVSYKKDKSVYFSKNMALKATTTTITATDIPAEWHTEAVAMDSSSVALTSATPTDNIILSTAETPVAPVTTSAVDAISSSTREQTVTASGIDQDIFEQTTEQQTTTTQTVEGTTALKGVLSTLTGSEVNGLTETVQITTSSESDGAATTPLSIGSEVDDNSSVVSSNSSGSKHLSTTGEITLPYTEVVEETDTESQSPVNEIVDLTSPSTHDLREASTEPLTTAPSNMNGEATATTLFPQDRIPKSSTEPILKLIDLEQHNVEVTDDREHNNGHDGLKSIRKKQLIDKHYMDSISHSREVESLKDGELINLEMRHGYLGPILMEEKRIHPTHQPPHLNSIEAGIRNGQLVELKASQSGEVTTALSDLQPENIDRTRDGDPAVTSSEEENGPSTVLSTTVFQVADGSATKVPSKSASTLFTSVDDDEAHKKSQVGSKIESKISDIQIEVYDSTIDSIVASTNFKDADISAGKSTKPPLPIAQQERFTQYVIDRTETSTQESINFSTIQVASGKPEPAAIEIHINVSESLGNDSEDVDVSFPLSEFNGNGRGDEAAYDDVKLSDDIKLKIASNPPATNLSSKDKSDEVLVVEIVDNNDNGTESRGRTKNSDELFITDVKGTYVTPPPPPPPPPFQPNYDRDSDTIFYISNTEVKVGETLPAEKKDLDERKMKLENQFFPVNYMASTHPNVNSARNADDPGVADHRVYEEDIIVSSHSGNQADSLKIYRNRNDPSPPLDVTYVGESIIEVEQQSPDLTATTGSPADHVITPQPDVIIQPAILPEISIGVPVIGELPPQIELKEIDYMPNENHRQFGSSDEQSHKSISAAANDVDNHLDESSVQYGGDLIDESADGGFDGVEGSYPFGNPATMTKRKSNHMADYAHLYVNYGVNNMRKDELTADIKDSGEVALILDRKANDQSDQLNATFKEFLNKMIFNHSSGLNETERNTNVTAFSIMEDSMEDKNAEDIISLISLAIGLFIVILPVVVTCSMLWALRYLYKKYHSSSGDTNGNVDTVDAKGQANEDEAEKGEDMSRVARETKMDYNKDGVFVVEVARGIDSKTMPDSPIAEESQKAISMYEPKVNGTTGYNVANEKLTHNNAKVQIHSPPPEKVDEGPRSLHQIEEVEEPLHSPRLQGSGKNGIVDNYKSNVGLSQSDLSSTSSNDSNKGYSYGNQELYVVEQTGYSTSSPTGNIALKCDSKDIKDDDRNSENDKHLEITPERKEESKENEQSLSAIKKAKDVGQIGDERVTQNQEQDTPVGESTDNSTEIIHEAEKGNDYQLEKESESTEQIDELVVNENEIGDQIAMPSLNDGPKEDENNIESPRDIRIESENIKNSELQDTNEDGENEPENINSSKHSKSDHIIEQGGQGNDENKEKSAMIEVNDSDILNSIDHEQPLQEEHLPSIGENGGDEASPTEGANDDEKVQTDILNDPKQTTENMGHEDAPLNQNADRDIETNDGEIKDENPDSVAETNDDTNVKPTTQDEIADPNPIETNEIKADVSQTIEEKPLVQDTVNGEKENSAQDTIIFNGHIVNRPSENESSRELSQTNNMPEIISETKNKICTTVSGNGHINGVQDIAIEGGDVHKTTNGTSHISNGSDILPDLVPVELDSHQANATDPNGIHNSHTEFENGYDSIISLPEPPPNTDEMLCSDLSELQLDSLPPPPPPLVSELNGETFSLKDLPPPLTNSGPEPPPNEDMANLCATLPPPPPTTLHVSSSPAMNGNMHASPLTPPASPPPHFTNGLHTGLCPPIAVDVNGS